MHNCDKFAILGKHFDIEISKLQKIFNLEKIFIDFKIKPITVVAYETS